MEHNQTLPSTDQFKLSSQIITITDFKRLMRETKQVNEVLHQASIRKSGDSLELPRGSKALDAVCEENKLNLLKQDDRSQLLDTITQIDKHAPVMHLSFATSPADEFLHKLVEWFREQIHPHVLLQVGIQPSIAGGCTLRTPSKYFDFSLRQYLNKHEATLMNAIKGLEKA